MSGELEGIRVVVTRSSHQSAALLEALAERGADAIALPLLEVLPPDDPRPIERAATELALYDWLVLTSANAVESLLERSGGLVPARLQIAVDRAGDRARVARLRDRAGVDRGREPAPKDWSRSSRRGSPAGAACCCRRPRTRGALLAEELEKAGAEVVRVTAYRKRAPAGTVERARELFATQPWGWVTFTSPSTVRNLAEALGPALWSEGRATLDAASIGPTTSAELRKFGAEPAVEAGSPIDGEPGRFDRGGGIATPPRIESSAGLPGSYGNGRRTSASSGPTPDR